jgi:hypothetical protein
MRTRSRIGYVLALLAAIALMAAGCTSPERLTSKATPCTAKEVRIQQSQFSRNGSTTAWCAECKGKLYQCATTAERTRVECHVAREYDICR